MGEYLIDTNIVSDYFSRNLSEKGFQFMDAVINDVPILSVITQIELLCWKTETQEEEKIKEFIADSNVIELSNPIILECVKIRRNFRVKTPDAIIAATALTHKLTLITNNEKDFKSVEGLRLLNPFNL